MHELTKTLVVFARLQGPLLSEVQQVVEAEPLQPCLRHLLLPVQLRAARNLRKLRLVPVLRFPDHQRRSSQVPLIS